MNKAQGAGHMAQGARQFDKCFLPSALRLTPYALCLETLLYASFSTSLLYTWLSDSSFFGSLLNVSSYRV